VAVDALRSADLREVQADDHGAVMKVWAKRYRDLSSHPTRGRLMAAACYELALELVADLRRLDTQLRDTRRRIAAAVTSSMTTVTELFEVGSIVAATVIGDVDDVSLHQS
jgi:hypothetical protein